MNAEARPFFWNVETPIGLNLNHFKVSQYAFPKS